MDPVAVRGYVSLCRLYIRVPRLVLVLFTLQGSISLHLFIVIHVHLFIVIHVLLHLHLVVPLVTRVCPHMLTKSAMLQKGFHLFFVQKSLQNDGRNRGTVSLVSKNLILEGKATFRLHRKVPKDYNNHGWAHLLIRQSAVIDYRYRFCQTNSDCRFPMIT